MLLSLVRVLAGASQACRAGTVAPCCVFSSQSAPQKDALFHTEPYKSIMQPLPAWVTAILGGPLHQTAAMLFAASNNCFRLACPHVLCRGVPGRGCQFIANRSVLLPLQVHLTYLNGTAVIISWATGNGVIGNTTNATTPVADWQSVNSPIQSIVRIGTQPGQYTNNATGFTTNCESMQRVRQVAAGYRRHCIKAFGSVSRSSVHHLESGSARLL